MTRKTIRISSEIEKEIKEILEKYNISFNLFINIAISEYLSKAKNSLIDFNYFGNSNDNEFRIFLSDREKEFLEQEANNHGFNSITKEIRYRLMNTIYNNKFYTNFEMIELAKAINDLNKFGRNFNEIVKYLRENDGVKFNMNYEVFGNNIEEIVKIFREINNAILSDRTRLELRV